MKKIINKVNVVAGEIGKRTEPIMKKTEIMVAVQKLKSHIRSLENHNEYDLCDLGEIVFAKYRDGLVEDEDFVAICEEIDQRLNAIDSLEARIVKLKGIELCDNCEMPLQKDVFFCPNCGAKVEQPEVEEEEEPASEEVEVIFEEGDIVEVLESDDAEIEIEFIVEAEETVEEVATEEAAEEVAAEEAVVEEAVVEEVAAEEVVGEKVAEEEVVAEKVTAKK